MRGTSYWDDLKHLQSSKIGQATRSRRPGSPTATRLWPREGGLQNTKRPNSNLSSPRASGHRSSFRGQKREARALFCRHFSRVCREIPPPPGACLRIYEDRSRRPNRSTNRTPTRELKSHGLCKTGVSFRVSKSSSRSTNNVRARLSCLGPCLLALYKAVVR